MKAVAINGSPRRGGNTEILLKQALAPLAAAGWETEFILNHMFLMSGAIVPGSTYWNLGFGREKGEVARDDEAARNMDDLGRTIAWLGEALHEHAGKRPVAAVRE